MDRRSSSSSSGSMQYENNVIPDGTGRVAVTSMDPLYGRRQSGNFPAASGPASRPTSSNSLPVMSSPSQAGSSPMYRAVSDSSIYRQTSISNPSQPPGSIHVQQTPGPGVGLVGAQESESRGFKGCWLLMLLLVMVVVLITIIFTIVLSNQESGVSSHMIVHTGRRTRDWSSVNSYSANTFDGDQHTRLYICMKAADIRVPDDPSIEEIGRYITEAKDHHNCGQESDRGWPRDYGFLRCIQMHFGANFHQSNVFLKCLDLSEGEMVESIQTPSSVLFLGSYNFVTMLLASMGVITAFLIFTAGGYYTSSEFHDSHGHISSKHSWSPLSRIPTLTALAWSLFMWVATMIYAFPPNNMWSDAIDETPGSLPGTPWTGFMCAGVAFGLVLFFASCLAEWFDDTVNHGMNNSSSVKKNDDSGPGDVETVNSQRSIFATQFYNTKDRSGYSHISTELGVKYNHNLHYKGSEQTNIAPALNKIFAFTWVLADGLLFIGMLNSQNSLLNENVVAIWFYIVLCRGFQLAASFFMDDVLFINNDINQNVINSHTQEQVSASSVVGFQNLKPLSGEYIRNIEIKAHAGIAVACSHLASLWCMVAVVYHFGITMRLVAGLGSAGVNNPTFMLQLFFIIFICVMDLIKHVTAFITIFDYLSQDHYLLIIEATFNADWVIRSIFITAAMFGVPRILWEANQNLRSAFLLSNL